MPPSPPTERLKSITQHLQRPTPPRTSSSNRSKLQAGSPKVPPCDLCSAESPLPQQINLLRRSPTPPRTNKPQTTTSATHSTHATHATSTPTPPAATPPAPTAPTTTSPAPTPPTMSVSTINPTDLTMAHPTRPPITCHVLDTTLGRPAENIPVSLFLIPSTPTPVSSLSTNTHTQPTPPPTGTSTSAVSLPIAAPNHPTCTTTTPTHLASGTTNSDGRISSWTYAPAGHGGHHTLQPSHGQVYMLRFDTAHYFRKCHPGDSGGAFWPWIDVVFVIGGGEPTDVATLSGQRHYHVPVLLSRFGYTTYRGS